jgi:CRP-like cAMP-binding protein
MNTEKRTGTDEYVKFATRILRSYARKAQAAEVDVTALSHMAILAAQVEEQTVAMVAALRSEAGGAYSWAQIGDALGMTRSAAFKRYAHLVEAEGARRPGGQPAHLR